MSALAQELPHPYSADRHDWCCISCNAVGTADTSDLVPTACPACASAYIQSEDSWNPDDDEDDFDA